MAAVNGMLSQVQTLAEGATHQELNEALMYALGQRHFAIVNWLLSHGAQPQDTVIRHIGMSSFKTLTFS